MKYLSHELDQRAQLKNLHLKDFTTRIPKTCFEIKETKAFLTLARTLFLLACFEALLSLTNSSAIFTGAKILLIAPLWILIASCFVGLFVMGHDCGHYAFSKKRWINDAIGTLCHAPLLTNFYAWRLGHNAHHTHTQKRGIDPDWPEKRITQEEFLKQPWHKKIEHHVSPHLILMLELEGNKKFT